MLTTNEKTELDILLTIKEPSDLEQIRINYLQTKRDSSTYVDEPENSDDEDCTCISCTLKKYKGKPENLPYYMAQSFAKNLNLKYPLPELNPNWNALQIFDEYIDSLPEEANEGKELEYGKVEHVADVLPSLDLAFFNRLLTDLSKTDNIIVFTSLMDINLLNTMATTTEILIDKGFSYKSSAIFSLNYIKEILDTSLSSIKLASSRLTIDAPMTLKKNPEELLISKLREVLSDVR